jgi:hypothetical protein
MPLFFKQVTDFLQQHNLITRGSRSSRSGFFLLLQAVHPLDDEEYAQGNNKKVNYVLDKEPYLIEPRLRQAEPRLPRPSLHPVLSAVLPSGW